MFAFLGGGFYQAQSGLALDFVQISGGNELLNSASAEKRLWIFVGSSVCLP